MTGLIGHDEDPQPVASRSRPVRAFQLSRKSNGVRCNRPSAGPLEGAVDGRSSDAEQAAEFGGAGVERGWLKDRFGVSWQVVPTVLLELVDDPDPGRAQRATQAMPGMGKIARPGPAIR